MLGFLAATAAVILLHIIRGLIASLGLVEEVFAMSVKVLPWKASRLFSSRRYLHGYVEMFSNPGL